MTVPVLNDPIVLVHGLLGYDEIRFAGRRLFEYFSGITDHLRSSGNCVLVPRLSLTRGVAERAEQLKQFLNRELPGKPIHLIAHSMGGLDSRYMISRLEMAERVRSLTTIGTPHRGSPFADWGIRRLALFLQPWFRTLGIPEQAFLDLTTSACRKFNELTPDSPQVRYFSVAGRFDSLWSRPSWWPAFSVVKRAEGPNDGIVSVKSATYGEKLIIWPGDHFNLINMPNPYEQLRRRWRDRAADYAELVRRLAEAGF